MLGQSENPALQQIEVRKVADLPSLAIVERAGDASPAAAVTIRAAPDVVTDLAAILRARLEAEGLLVERRVDHRSFALGVRGVDAAVAFFPAVRAALARPITPNEVPAHAEPRLPARAEDVDVDECEGRARRDTPFADAAGLEAARAGLDPSSIAFGLVGPEAAIEPASRAWGELAAFQGGAVAPASPWPSARTARVGVSATSGTTDLRVALFVPDPLRAVSGADALQGDAGDALRSKLARSPHGFRLAAVHGVSRAEGGCISVSLTSSASLGDDADEGIASAASAVELALADAAALPSVADAALERVARARDPVEAAELAAWWTFARDRGGDAVGAVSVTLPKPREAAAKPLQLALEKPPPSAPTVDRVDRDETGQGELWVMLGNPCAAIEEGAHAWGTTSLAARARALDASGRAGVVVESFAGADGIGVIAHAPVGAAESDDGLAVRVARVAAFALLGAAPTRDALGRAGLGAIDDLERDWGPRAFGVDAFARAFQPDHPTLVEPRGTVADVVRIDYARATSAWATLAAGPVRLVTLANRGIAQGDAAAKTIAAWLSPTQARGCAKLASVEPDRSVKQLDVGLEGRATARYGLEAEPAMAVVLARLVADKRPSADVRRVDGRVIVSLHADRDTPSRPEPGGLAAEVTSLADVLESISQGSVPDDVIERARRGARAEALRAASDPRERLLELFSKRATPASLAPVEPASVADFKAWAKANAAPARWVVVQAR